MARVSRAVPVSAVVIAVVASGFAVGVPSAGANVPVRSYTGERRLTDVPAGTTRISAAARRIHANVDARLADAAVITGTVSMQHSSRLPQSMWVNVYDAKQRHIAFVDTDAAGTYRFVGLAPVRYSICPGAADDGQPTGYRAHCRDLTPGQGTTTVEDLVVSHAGAIEGQVTDAAGKIAYRVDAYLFRDGKPVGTRSRDWSGHYSFLGLDPGDDYQVCFDARRSHGSQPVGYLSVCTGGVRWDYRAGVPAGASDVSVSVDQTATADITLPRAGAIDGGVFGARPHRVPLAGSHVVVYKGRAVVRRTRADSHGHYRVLGLSAGRYRVCATSRSRQRRCTEHRVHVVIGHMHTIVLLLRVDPDWSPAAGGQITGRVTWHGWPVRDSRVEIFDSLGSAFGAGRTDAHGRYHVKLAPTSSGYRVCFLDGRVAGRPRRTGYASTCYGQHVWGGAAPPHHATPVVVRSGRTTRGVGATRVRGAAISGVVRADNGGAPIHYAQAIAVNSLDEVVGVATTAADGSYTIRDLTPQARGYTVCFVQPPSPTKGFGFVGECYRNEHWYGQMVDVVGPKHRLP